MRQKELLVRILLQRIKREVHRQKHYWKMKINEILECFNKVLDIRGNPGKIHFVAYSSLEKKIGTIKQVTTVITLCDPQKGNTEFVKNSMTGVALTGLENKLIEESQKE